MLQFMIAAIIICISITWYLRSLKINKKYEDLYVVVTGCDSGFGQELTYRLDRFGFNVFATCLAEDGALKLNNSTTGRVQTAKVDISNPNSISKLVSTVKKTIKNDKSLWAVVNNAGIIGPFGICSLLRKEHYLETMDVNLFGMIEITKHFLPLLRRSKGRIINISSVSGRFAHIYPPYAVSKFSIEAYSDCLRRELYHQGVSVHIIEPGMFATDLQKCGYKDNVIHNYQRCLNEAHEKDREFYGSDYPERIAAGFSIWSDSASKDTYKVINAYFHALTARFPKARYIVGIDANTVFRFFWTCPEWMSDFICAYASGPGSVKPAAVMK